MSNILGVTIDGKFKVGEKAFITVNGVHREVKKAFITVNGVHRECYSSVVWIDTSILIDFEYVLNDDGTATLTAWKETLNGVPSTELVIPDDPKIIL